MSLVRAGVTGLSFEGRGDRIARGFYIPVLKESVEYDRAFQTSFSQNILSEFDQNR